MVGPEKLPMGSQVAPHLLDLIPPLPLLEVFIIITLVGKVFVVIKTGFTTVTTSVAG